jgi:molecular chaperone GrpE
LATATAEIQTLLAGYANAMQEVDRLQAAAASSAKELEEARAFVARARADMDMQRRRLQKEKEELQRSAGEEILREMFPALDNFSYAVELSRTGTQDAASLAQGMEMIHRELTSTLARAGLELIRDAGIPFDPQVHDAVSAESDDTRPNGEVLAVLRPGYRLRDKVLRPAMVKVNRVVARETPPKPTVAESEPPLESDFDRES